MTRIDLERLDESAADLGAWADTEPLPVGGPVSEQDPGCRDRTHRRERADERLARAELYPSPRNVTAAPITCPIHEEGAAALERPAP